MQVRYRVLAPDAGDMKPVIRDLADVGRPPYQRHAVSCSRKHTADGGTDGACAHYCDVSDALWSVHVYESLSCHTISHF